MAETINRYPVDFSAPIMHVRMLQNREKYKAFVRALQGRVAGKVVVDAGAGCGIISLICAHLGAAKVIAIERPGVCIGTRKLLARYPCAAETINLIASDVFELVKAYGIEADVIVSETIGYLGFEENLAAIAHHVACVYAQHRRPLFVPARLQLFAAPVRATSLVPQPAYLSSTLPRLSRATSRSCPPALQVGASLPSPLRFAWNFLVGPDTAIAGVLFFFSADLSQGIVLTNRYSPGWPRLVLPLQKVVYVKRRSTLRISLRLDASGPAFRISAQAVLDKEILESRCFFSDAVVDVRPQGRDDADWDLVADKACEVISEIFAYPSGSWGS